MLRAGEVCGYGGIAGQLQWGEYLRQTELGFESRIVDEAMF